MPFPVYLYFMFSFFVASLTCKTSLIYLLIYRVRMLGTRRGTGKGEAAGIFPLPVYIHLFHLLIFFMVSLTRKTRPERARMRSYFLFMFIFIHFLYSWFPRCSTRRQRRTSLVALPCCSAGQNFVRLYKVSQLDDEQADPTVMRYTYYESVCVSDDFPPPLSIIISRGLFRKHDQRSKWITTRLWG